jgi:hypothetical protein
LANYPAGLQIESREQGGRAMALVVVRAAFQLPRTHGQHRLCAIQCLDLALFIHAEDQRVIGWVHVEAHNIPHFLDE